MRHLLLVLLLPLLNIAHAGAVSESRLREIAAWLPDAAAGYGPTCSDRSAWNDTSAVSRLAAVIKDAEKRLKQPFPAWSDEAYLEYSKNGTRSNGERMMNARKAFLYPLVIAECVENQGRFLPLIEKTLTELSGQPSWTWPAHDRNLRNFKQRNYEVDLFAADTAHEIAQALYLLGDRLSPETRRRTSAELEARIFAPLRKTFASGNKDNWWLHADHNWNAVCLKASVAAALATLPNRDDRALFAAAGEHYIRNYLTGFPADGYSMEGAGYWNYGFSHFVELREILLMATKQRIDLFTDAKVRQIALYGAKIEMFPGNIAAFSDATVREKIDGFTLAYANEALSLGLPGKLAALPVTPNPSSNSAPLAQASMLLFAKPQAISATAAPLDPLRGYFAEVGILVTRPAPGSGSRLAATIKAGGNANHSHNDIGSYTIALGSEQPTGDIGRAPYTSKTFSKERYTIKALNSWGHPLPVIAGTLQSEATKVKPKVLSTRFTAESDEIRIELAPAYAVPALNTLTRTLRHDRTGSDTISIEDRFEYRSADTFETALTTLGEWQRRPDGMLELWQKKEHLLARIEASAPFEIFGEKVDEDGIVFQRIAIRLKNPQAAGWVRVTMQAAN